MCAYCQKTFLRITDLRIHVSEHPQRIVDFNQRKRRPTLEFHKVEISNLLCTICSKNLSSLDELKDHLTSNHCKEFDPNQDDGLVPYLIKNENYTCVHCGLYYTSFMNLMKHNNIHYQKHICDTCGTGFSTRYQLQSHMLGHNLGAFPCSKCESIFKSRAARNTHIAHVHTIRRYKCPHCDESFVEYRHRMKHLKEMHNVNVQFRCTSCPAVFQTCSARRQHVQKVHIGIHKIHFCAECPSAFATPCQLKRHMIRHGGEKIHKCMFCHKAYARQSTLKEHLRIHYNDRRFVCAVCSQAFVQKCSLKQHMRVHHPDFNETECK